MANMKTVSDSTSRGNNYLPSAAANSDRTPAPTPAANSGKKINFPGISQPVATPMGKGKQ